MNTFKIFESIPCCAKSVNPELIQINLLCNKFQNTEINIKRYNLTKDPQEFISDGLVNEFIQQYGMNQLPVTTYKDQIIKTGIYPTEAEINGWVQNS